MKKFTRIKWIIFFGRQLVPTLPHLCAQNFTVPKFLFATVIGAKLFYEGNLKSADDSLWNTPRNWLYPWECCIQLLDSTESTWRCFQVSNGGKKRRIFYDRSWRLRTRNDRKIRQFSKKKSIIRVTIRALFIWILNLKCEMCHVWRATADQQCRWGLAVWNPVPFLETSSQDLDS